MIKEGCGRGKTSIAIQLISFAFCNLFLKAQNGVVRSPSHSPRTACQGGGELPHRGRIDASVSRRA
jgi:hypothetical protein